jgi:hypothetical protein
MGLGVAFHPTARLLIKKEVLEKRDKKKSFHQHHARVLLIHSLIIPKQPVTVVLILCHGEPPQATMDYFFQ